MNFLYTLAAIPLAIIGFLILVWLVVRGAKLVFSFLGKAWMTCEDAWDIVFGP